MPIITDGHGTRVLTSKAPVATNTLGNIDTATALNELDVKYIACECGTSVNAPWFHHDILCPFRHPESRSLAR